MRPFSSEPICAVGVDGCLSSLDGFVVASFSVPSHHCCGNGGASIFIFRQRAGALRRLPTDDASMFHQAQTVAVATVLSAPVSAISHSAPCSVPTLPDVVILAGTGVVQIFFTLEIRRQPYFSDKQVCRGVCGKGVPRDRAATVQYSLESSHNAAWWVFYALPIVEISGNTPPNSHNNLLVN